MINKILKLAAEQIGVKEEPHGSNNVIYNTEYYGRKVWGADYPWCCAFIWWLFKKCDMSNLFYDGKKTAYCPTVENYYKSKGQWYTSNPKVGDLVLFDFTGKGIAGHIGILEKVNQNGTYTVIEGNTAITSNDNGGCVMRRTRYKANIRGFARPNYSDVANNSNNSNNSNKEEVKTVNITLTQLQKGHTGKQVQTLQRLLEAFGFSVGRYGHDGDFGSDTDKAVRAFQKGNGLSVDGIVGINTWTKLLK